MSTPPSHGGLEALVAPDRARQEGRAKTELQLLNSRNRNHAMNLQSGNKVSKKIVV
jgi:hypothetical protein